MSLESRVKALEAEVRALGEPDWPAVARALAAVEGPEGTFHLPADAPAEVVSMAKLICSMVGTMPRDPRTPAPAVFIDGNRVWPPQGAESATEDEDYPREPEGPSGACGESGGCSA